MTEQSPARLLSIDEPERTDQLRGVAAQHARELVGLAETRIEHEVALLGVRAGARQARVLQRLLQRPVHPVRGFHARVDDQALVALEPARHESEGSGLVDVGLNDAALLVETSARLA